MEINLLDKREPHPFIHTTIPAQHTQKSVVLPSHQSTTFCFYEAHSEIGNFRQISKPSRDREYPFMVILIYDSVSTTTLNSGCVGCWCNVFASSFNR